MAGCPNPAYDDTIRVAAQMSDVQLMDAKDAAECILNLINKELECREGLVRAVAAFKEAGGGFTIESIKTMTLEKMFSVAVRNGISIRIAYTGYPCENQSHMNCQHKCCALGGELHTASCDCCGRRCGHGK